jgi:hypothetical protein
VDYLLAGFGNELLGFGDSTADPVNVLPSFHRPGRRVSHGPGRDGGFFQHSDQWENIDALWRARSAAGRIGARLLAALP